MRLKNSPGCENSDCGCGCCGPLEAPAETVLSTPAGETKLDTDWTTDPCCKTVTLYPDSTAWQYACSDAARTQQINESFDYKVYLRQLQVVTGATGPTLECVINKDGTETCTLVDANGNPITCDETQTLCTTLTQTASQTRSLHAAAKYRLTKIETTLYRIDNQCEGEEEPTCKFVLVARAFIDVFYGNIIKQYLSRSTTGETSCCVINADYDTLIDETCQDAIERSVGGFQYVSIILTRSKWFSEMPSGTITLTAEDEIDCDKTLQGCVNPTGEPCLQIATGNVGAWTTTTASCANNVLTTLCRGLYDFGGTDCILFIISNQATRSVGVVNANILASLHTSVSYICNPACGPTSNGNATACPQPCDQKEIWDLECDNLMSYVTDSGYTPKTLDILCFPWVFEITP